MYEYSYEPTPSETEIFLSDEPLNLTKEHIRTQFKDPLSLKFDYVGSFIETYRCSEQMIESDEDSEELERLNSDFIQFMLHIFEDKLGLGFPDFDMKSTEDQHEILHMVYRYFITNVKHNFSCFCLNYINKHKKEIAEQQPKKKDVTSLNLKKDIIDPEDIAIVTNLYDIINEIIFDMDHDVDVFIRNSDRSEPRLETEVIDEYFNDFVVTGNFYQHYRLMLNSIFIKEIECKIRNKLLKAYKSKK